MPAPIAPLDTHLEIETPEGIELNIRIAGPPVRATAWLIDLLITMAAYWLLAIILTFIGYSGMGLMLLSVFII
ncbi:MAG: hypothetical protein KZQ58_11420 [gamma proteobacterium symbiont of Bathyaustriella thionipta]|nr:hypothetical protein [gamma proteobacterium symbiont of Bathyaustriella thionipta]